MYHAPFRNMFVVTSHMSSEVAICPDALIEEDDEPIDDELDEIRTGFDMISCALCVGAWVSLAVAMTMDEPLSWHLWFSIYGGSYFLVTQQR